MGEKGRKGERIRESEVGITDQNAPLGWLWTMVNRLSF